jgi:uncharacterized protein (TIGR02147 family)
MNKKIYQYSNYQEYLIYRLGDAGSRSGKRSALAKEISCQNSFISQVLVKKQNLSLEQAFKVSEFLSHSSEESDFFILMVEKERAGTPELKNYFKKKLALIVQQRTEIESRLQKTRKIPAEHQAKYYGQWYYIAIHLAVSIPSLQTKNELQAYFNLPSKLLEEVLGFLLELGLIIFQDDRYQMSPTHIHIGRSSSELSQHHTNWRLEALKSLSHYKEDDVHYSVVYSLSNKDAKRINEEILLQVEKIQSIVAPSKEESLFCYNLDFFEVSHPFSSSK